YALHTPLHPPHISFTRLSHGATRAGRDACDASQPREERMRANAVLGGLLLVLGLTVPVTAQTSDVALAVHGDDAAGRAMGGPSMQGGRGFGGWQQRAGPGQMRRGRSVTGMGLRHRPGVGVGRPAVGW